MINNTEKKRSINKAQKNIKDINVMLYNNEVWRWSMIIIKLCGFFYRQLSH